MTRQTFVSKVMSLLFNMLSAAAAAKSLQSCPTLCDPIDSSPHGSGPWDSPGKNTGVGCHFLLQCMKVKSKSEVPQSCPTPCDPMDCSSPGSSIHGIFQARVLESRLVITFIPRSKHLLMSWLQSLSAVILEPKKIKSDTISTVTHLFPMK